MIGSFMESILCRVMVALDSGLWCCSPASGMSHYADGRQTRGGAGRRATRGRVSLVNAQASRSTVARSASGPYHAAVTGRQPYRAGGCVSSRAVRIRFSGNNAIVMPQILSKYVRWCYIIHVVLCNRMGVDCIRYCNLNALFDTMVGKGETNG